MWQHGSRHGAAEGGKVTEGGVGLTESTGDGEGPSLTRTGFWVAAIGTAASASLALYFGLNVRHINSMIAREKRNNRAAVESDHYLPIFP